MVDSRRRRDLGRDDVEPDRCGTRGVRGGVRAGGIDDPVRPVVRQITSGADRDDTVPGYGYRARIDDPALIVNRDHRSARDEQVASLYVRCNESLP